MKALLLVAHGSRRAESNDEIAALADRVSDRAGEQFELIEHAFLELAEPSIPDGIELCLKKGATSVTVLPYFLARGTHVVEDIPAEVAKKQQEYPDIAIRIAPYLGTVDELPDVLLALAVK